MAQDFQPDLTASFDALQRPIPTGPHPDGSVIGDIDASLNLPENPEILHRPHAFALMHGDGGAKVAYGQLLWRYDVLIFEVGSAGGQLDSVGQGYINRYRTVTPTVGAADGAAMVAGLNTKYHELGSYGDVYLYWTTDLDASSIENTITGCWVQVGATPAEDDLDNETNRDDAFDRVAGINATDAQKEGTYRVKLGTVNEDEEIIQNHSSDVFWSFVLFKRYA